jgi:hypothetical protein
MAPFTRDHCPVCSTQTTQHFLAQAEASKETGEEPWSICEGCLTVLIYGEDGLIGQRPATEEERAVCLPQVSPESLAAMREELRRGWADYQEWERAGCPGLTAEMLRDMPALAAALARRGVRLPQSDGGAAGTGSHGS